MNIDWVNLPYDHAGTWSKKHPSIMNPGENVTWPQLMAEFVVFWRRKFINDYKNIPNGPGWYKSISKAVRELNQQAAVICNYFEHPDKEPLIIVATKNFFRNNKPCKIGRYKKNRVGKNGNLTIEQAEKDVVLGISAELERLIKQRTAFVACAKPQVPEGPVTFKTDSATPKKGSLAHLLEIEKQIKP